MPGWQGSTRRATLPADWDKRRTAILVRDQNQCQHVRTDTGRKCGAYANQVDHIDQRRRWDHGPSNLEALCEWHHLRKSGGEGGRAASAQRARRRAAAPKPKHPGLLD